MNPKLILALALVVLALGCTDRQIMWDVEPCKPCPQERLILDCEPELIEVYIADHPDICDGLCEELDNDKLTELSYAHPVWLRNNSISDGCALVILDSHNSSYVYLSDNTITCIGEIYIDIQNSSHISISKSTIQNNITIWNSDNIKLEKINVSTPLLFDNSTHCYIIWTGMELIKPMINRCCLNWYSYDNRITYGY